MQILIRKLGWNHTGGVKNKIGKPSIEPEVNKPKKIGKFYQRANFMGLPPPPPFTFSFCCIFLSVSSIPSCRSWWQLQFSPSSVTIYQPRGAEDNSYFQELKDVREIWLQVMAASDRYCHPEGISKRHLIFTYQHQPYPTGKHVSPPQSPLFNCFELSIQYCFSPPVSEGVPASHMYSGYQMTCTAAQYNARVTCLLVRRGHYTLASLFPAAVISTALGYVQNTQAETTSRCMDKFGVAQHCHPPAHHGSPKNPLSPPLHHNLGPEGMHLSSPHQDGGEVWPIWKYFLFYKCSALGMCFFFFSLGTVTRTRAEQEQLAEKTNRATMCFQPCPAVTCFYRTLGSCCTTLTWAAYMLLHRILFALFLTKYLVFPFSQVSAQETGHKFASYSLEKA